MRAATVLADYVISRDGRRMGRVVGSRRCTLEGCRSFCFGVRWPDGSLTWPCRRGCREVSPGVWRIQ